MPPAWGVYVAGDAAPPAGPKNWAARCSVRRKTAPTSAASASCETLGAPPCARCGSARSEFDHRAAPSHGGSARTDLGRGSISPYESGRIGPGGLRRSADSGVATVFSKPFETV